MEKYVQMGELFDYGKKKLGIFYDNEIPCDKDNIVLLIVDEDENYKEYWQSFHTYIEARKYIERLLEIQKECLE